MHAEAWLALHLPQLTHYNAPHHLHKQIYDCIHENEGDWSDLDAVATTKAASETTNRRKLRVEASMPLPAAEKVLRVAHEWNFTSIPDAQTQLRHNEALRSKIIQLAEDAILEDKEAIESEEESEKEQEVERIIRQLHLLAFSIRFGAKSDEMAYYVLNTLGSSLRENDDERNLQVMPIFCMEQQKLFSVAWTTRDVPSGVELLLNSYILKTQRVLIAGTGTSRLPLEMALDGYTDIVAVDYAANVIEKMQTRSKENNWGVRFLEADLTQMKGWESNSVDCVVDKGCLDAMLLQPETDAVDTNWKLVAPESPDDLSDVKNSMQQLARVLRPDGLLFFLTFGSPSNRVNMFDWTSDTEECMEWDILQCLEMSPTRSQHTFVTRFYLFVVRKKLI
ncbi:Methyltransferase domain [Phytophthora infestans]|uniref:Methyltransferase domain n=1 Tax=Phytophthora infestans TaxID=4787 RepID=A0A833WU99_PHYIN|nr:Methyltransferase domain [Phytophthora infestans]